MTLLLLLTVALAMTGVLGETEKKLKIDVTHSVDACERKTKNGDRIHMHYTVRRLIV